MIEETRKYYCDACGKEIDGYMNTTEVIEVDDEGYAESVGRDFCKDCAISFQEWLKSRRATGPKESPIDKCR